LLRLLTRLPSSFRSAIDGFAARSAPAARTVGQARLDVVGVEAPKRNQPADAGIEQVVAGGGDGLRLADVGGELRGDLVVRPAAMASFSADSSEGCQAW
jgi:hypothetical protein